MKTIHEDKISWGSIFMIIEYRAYTKCINKTGAKGSKWTGIVPVRQMHPYTIIPFNRKTRMT